MKGRVVWLDGVCRVCIENAAKYTPLSTNIALSSNLSFLDFLNKCTNLNASESDKLPQNLCTPCTNSLKNFYSFVKLAEKSNVILRETWNSLLATGRCNNERISCGTITNERIDKESEDFKPTGSSLHVLDIEKESPRVSEKNTSTFNFKDVEIKSESEKSNSNLDQPEGSIEEFVSARRIDADHIDFGDNMPIAFLKRRLAQIEDGTDWNPSNMKKKTGKTRAKCKEATNEEAPGSQNILCSGLIDNNEISCEEIAIKKEKIEEESEVFRKENPFHCQTNENSSGSSLYILDTEKEEVCVSDDTSIVDSKDPENKERERSKSNLDQPEGHIKESDDILSYIDDYLTNIFAEHSEPKDNAPITLMKRGLNKNDNKIYVQNDDDQSHCIPSNVKKKTSKSIEISTESEEVIKRRASVRQKTKTEYKNDITIGHAGTNQISSGTKDDSLTPNVPGSTESISKCIECDFDINESEDFTTNSREHLVIRKETTKYKCSICGKGFIHLSCRWKHMKLHGKNPCECEICGEKLRNKAEHKSHLRVHSNIRFTCPQCGREYKTKRGLLSHIDSHASNHLECKTSSKEITSKQSLNIHIENSISCRKCDKEFESLDALTMHMKSHIKIYRWNGNKIKCQQCGKEFKYRSSLCLHMKKHPDPKPFKCEKCGETFRKKHELKVHMENHTKKCDQCGKEFQYKSSLNRHMRRQHTNLKPLEHEKCLLCSKQFRSKHTLNVHMENHTKKCDQCGKEFKYKSSLNRHMRRQHTNPKQLEHEKCSLCSKQFRSKHTLNVHMENHTRFTKKWYHCGKEFKNSDALKRHMKLHPGPNPTQKCEKCGKIFTKNYRFNAHMQTHSEIAMRCQQCGKVYKNRDHLRRHLRWHIDPKPFKCKNCGKLFAAKISHVKHMKICQPVCNSVEEPITIEESSSGSGN